MEKWKKQEVVCTRSVVGKQMVTEKEMVGCRVDGEGEVTEK